MNLQQYRIKKRAHVQEKAIYVVGVMRCLSKRKLAISYPILKSPVHGSLIFKEGSKTEH
jgi:hypothetical protein